ncbi:hypothetical protein GRI62_03680 [Erythrobacter arachoides]|uniref:Uncharacterized protein n=1 Tax=Aurantiacibacter arachoides TaxID=1850444 RepID=A0A845A166_9SPHN|nr:hypothetical protein [Aurantiacibacter arachoides]MXO92707.1 hypothetical protein [Aurantiacibacter arachoides]GGD55087.1 hypothetical protein GCM10011411_13810 [Aurantiacibacter arachoides]
MIRRLSAATRALAAASTLALAAATPATAQERPADLTTLPPVPTDFTPERLPWGDWDFTGTFPIEPVNNGHILFQRPEQYGDRFWVTDEEFTRRLEAARGADGNFTEATESGVGTAGTEGLEAWFRNTDWAKSTAMLVSPADGQLPALTPQARALFEAGRSGWVPGQGYNWVSDFDSWDRCVSRGFPASMYPFRYNNGIRIFQSPGVVTIVLEMLGTRVVKLYPSAAEARAAKWEEPVEAWMGNSRGWWEGKTLVIETTNIVSGDAATTDTSRRAAAPLNMATQFTGTLDVPAFNTVPMSSQAMTVERLTMTGPDTIIHELTYSDPEVYVAPWSTRVAWVRDEDYQFFEYACHEGNYMPRDYISASRAQQARVAAGEEEAVTAETDDRSRFARPFDWDPGVGPRPGPPPIAPQEDEDEDAEG